MGKVRTTYSYPDCIKFFLNRELRDGRHRMLFILTNYFKFRLTKKELYDFINKWNRYVHNGHLSGEEIRGQIEYHFEKKIAPGVKYYKSVLDDIGHGWVSDKCKHCQRVLEGSNTTFIK